MSSSCAYGVVLITLATIWYKNNKSYTIQYFVYIKNKQYNHIHFKRLSNRIVINMIKLTITMEKVITHIRYLKYRIFTFEIIVTTLESLILEKIDLISNVYMISLSML